MKKHLLLIILAYIAISANGQNPIPNGNFETWNSETYNYPKNYPYNSNFDAFFRYQSALPFNVVKTADSYHASGAIVLSTVTSGANTAFGYFINSNPEDGDPSKWTGGIPYTETPTGIEGYYKYNVPTGDSAIIFAVFSKAGRNIGTYLYPIGGLHNEWTQFYFNFNPPLAEAPDSVIFAATSSNIMVSERGVAGSVLQLDYVSFTGVSSQPAMMNGDFELWETQSISTPANWIMQSNYDQRGNENKTTDAHSGEYAMKLKTYLGENDGRPTARCEQISTGYYPDNCHGNCTELGGHTFTNTKDTLAFWYKYFPSTNEKAEVSMHFKKNGNSMDWRSIWLSASAEYQYFEIPLELWQTPDTVIVHAQSTRWEDTLVSAIGSVLIIDDIHFKSQNVNTGIQVSKAESQFFAFPNPSSGKFKILKQEGINQVKVFNMLGKQVFMVLNPSREELDEIDLTRFKKGIYFMEISTGDKKRTEKIMIQ